MGDGHSETRWREFFESRGMMEGDCITCQEDSVLEIHFRDGTFHSIFPQSQESKPTLVHGVVQIVHPGKETLFYGASEITFVRQRVNPRYHATKVREYAVVDEEDAPRPVREVQFKEMQPFIQPAPPPPPPPAAAEDEETGALPREH